MAVNKRDLLKLKSQNEWKKEFIFLSFTPQHLLCKVCTKFNDKIISCKNYNANFIKGCTNFRKSAVIDHANSEMHKKPLEHQETENAKERGQAFFTKKNKKTVAAAAWTAIGNSLKKKGQMSNIQREGIEKLFHIAYFCASKVRPYTDFSDLVELENYMRLNVYQVDIMKMKQLAKISFHFVPNQ